MVQLMLGVIVFIEPIAASKLCDVKKLMTNPIYTDDYRDTAFLEERNVLSFAAVKKMQIFAELMAAVLLAVSSSVCCCRCLCSLH